MLIVFHCRQTFIKDADGKPYILIVFAPISGFTLLSRISFPIIFQHFKMQPETSLQEPLMAMPRHTWTCLHAWAGQRAHWSNVRGMLPCPVLQTSKKRYKFLGIWVSLWNDFMTCFWGSASLGPVLPSSTTRAGLMILSKEYLWAQFPTNKIWWWLLLPDYIFSDL